MAQRFFTADFHLFMEDILRFESRPFKSISKMNSALIGSCFQDASEDDIIIHVGDLYSFKSDRGNEGGQQKPSNVINLIPSTFINIRGNHDINNKVKSTCDSMRVHFGARYPNVSVSHYPSYDKKAYGNFINGDIHICGHVHKKWRHCLDLDHQVLNINVGVDMWGYKIISEERLIKYIDRLLSHKPSELYRCKEINGKIVFYGNPII